MKNAVLLSCPGFHLKTCHSRQCTAVSLQVTIVTSIGCLSRQNMSCSAVPCFWHRNEGGITTFICRHPSAKMPGWQARQEGCGQQGVPLRLPMGPVHRLVQAGTPSPLASCRRLMAMLLLLLQISAGGKAWGFPNAGSAPGCTCAKCCNQSQQLEWFEVTASLSNGN